MQIAMVRAELINLKAAQPPAKPNGVDTEEGHDADRRTLAS